MNIDELPEFIKNRITGMPENVQKAFLSTITLEWVEGQVAAHEIVKGLDEGKWTIEDIRAAAKKSQVP